MNSLEGCGRLACLRIRSDASTTEEARPAAKVKKNAGFMVAVVVVAESY